MQIDDNVLPLAVAEFLCSPDTQPILMQLGAEDLGEAYTLRLLGELRRSFTAQQAGALLTMARLRQRAQNKFPAAHQLFFTTQALEQATAWPVALHRAAQLDAIAAPGPILDAGCGIGGDTLALAQFRPVIAYERDPIRLRFARANAKVLGLDDRIDLRDGDWTAELTSGRLPAISAAYVDPARRKADKRIFSLHQMEPPLSEIQRLRVHVPIMAVKVMPGVDTEEVPPNCNVEFVSHERVCKEAVLWFAAGEQNYTTSAPRRASVYGENGWVTVNASGQPAPVGNVQVGQFLYEPDPAMIRAGALTELCTALSAHLFDSQIAYLIADEARPTPLAQCFRIEEIHPFALRLLNERLQALQIAQVELKKRGFPVEPEELRPRLKLAHSGRAGVVIFTRRGEERLMLIGERVTAK